MVKNDFEVGNALPGDWDTPEPIAVRTDRVYGTEHPIIVSYGDWEVTFDGDIIITPHWYPIWSEQLKNQSDNDDWILHLSDKGWFTEESYQNFKRAYYIACKIMGIKPTKQIHDYSDREHRKSVNDMTSSR